MLPILLSLGPIKIYSYGVFFALGLLVSLYFWWKMGRDEHFDEIALFDSFFLSLIVFGVVGRLGYVMFEAGEGMGLRQLFALLSYPGISGLVGIVGAGIFLWFFARGHNWNPWKVGDSAVVSLLMLLTLANLGGLLNGSNPGIEASWGIVYPGQDVARIPLDLVMFFWSLVSFGIVSRVRKNFRFYSWYKGEASSAQDGLATLIFMVATGLYYIGIPWISQNPWRVGQIPLAFIGGWLLLIGGTTLIYKRVGRREPRVWSKLIALLRRK